MLFFTQFLLILEVNIYTNSGKGLHQPESSMDQAHHLQEGQKGCQEVVLYSQNCSQTSIKQDYRREMFKQDDRRAPRQDDGKESRREDQRGQERRLQ